MEIIAVMRAGRPRPVSARGGRGSIKTHFFRGCTGHNHTFTQRPNSKDRVRVKISRPAPR